MTDMGYIFPPFDPPSPDAGPAPVVLTTTMGLNLMWDPTTDESWWEDADADDDS